MKIILPILGIVIAVVVFCASPSDARKKRKNKKLQWKDTSMPFNDERFLVERLGESLKMDCKAQGHPKPAIKWTKDGLPIRKKTSPNMKLKKFGLTLTDLSMEMEGNYTCEVKNKQGTLEWTFSVKVEGAVGWPLILEGPRDITKEVGSAAIFWCRVTNNPAAIITWQRQENDDFYDIKPQPNDPEMLIVENVQKKDEGKYRCVAGTILGMRHSTAKLTVIDPTVPPLTVPTDNNIYLPDDNGLWNNDYNNNNGHNNNNNGHGYIVTTGSTNWNRNRDFETSFKPIFPTFRPDFNLDPYYTTTKRPRKNKGRNKNGRRKKNRNKNKSKGNNKPDNRETTVLFSMPSTLPTDSTPSSTSYDFYDIDGTTKAKTVWNFDDGLGRDDRVEQFPDNRRNSPTEEGEDGKLGSSRSNDDDESPRGDISAWKIYTIVGAVGGVVLLMGLVAITIVVCCPKQEQGGYKGTPV